MKEIKLIDLDFRDFKGGTFHLAANGESLNVFATNSAGKTRLADAFHWVLFGKDSRNQVTFDIKTLGPDGQALHNQENTVEATISIDGCATTLKAVYMERWGRTRGRPDDEFLGNTTVYYVDDIRKAEKEYKELIKELVGDEEIFRLLTSPMAFPSLPWQKQRAILLDVCGNITDADVIASNEKLLPLAAILGKYKLDDYRKLIKDRESVILKSLGTKAKPGDIQIRIDEQTRSLPEVTGLDLSMLKHTIAQTEKQIAQTTLKLHGVDSGGTIAQLSKRLEVIKDDIRNRERRWYDDTIKTYDRTSQQLNEIVNEAELLSIKAESLKKEIAAYEQLLPGLDRELQKLRDEWHSVDDEAFVDTTEEVCAACGQPLPSDRVEEARERARAEFNRRKAERLTEIEARGKPLSARLAHTKEQIEALRKQSAPELSPEAQVRLGKLKDERDALKKMAEDYSSIPGWSSLVDERDELQKKIDAEKAGIAGDKKPVEEEIAQLESELKAAKADADKFDKRADGLARIEELKAEEKKLSAEYEKLEGELYLTELFVREKVKLLEASINKKFKLVRWKLFEYHVNGALNDQLCECTVNGVPWGSNLNSGARINAGMDICDTLMEHYQIRPPVFVDNAETIVDLIELPTQIIRLVVSEKDLALRVEPARETHVHASVQMGKTKRQEAML